MRNLILTGFMGTGKTTVGRVLAEQYGFRFVDLDAAIEGKGGRSVPEIFREGQDVFRRLETEALGECLESDNTIIASGAGALTFERNLALLQPDDLVIALTCELSELLHRLGDRTTRPLIADLEADAIAALMEERRASYSSFHQVSTTGRSPSLVAQEIGDRFELAGVANLSFDRQQMSSLVFGTTLAHEVGDMFESRGLEGDILIVTDDAVHAAGWDDVVSTSFGPHRAIHRVIVAKGEENKSLAGMETIYEACLSAGLDRQSIILGVGGGVVGDMAGFAAATYLRGLRLVLLPTTLLAQVDAAIGGKVGVDFGGAKNMLGAFHPATLVLIDPSPLSTLPDTALQDGLAEVIKIGTVLSRHLLQEVDSLRNLHNIASHTSIIRRAALQKVRVVAEDPFEHGVRALLNFGHTIGHALEAASGYQLSHGRAVSIGMVAETWIAVQLGVCPEEVYANLIERLLRFGLPLHAPGLNSSTALDFLKQDKKRVHGRTRIAVPSGETGRGDVLEVDEPIVHAAVERSIRGAA